MTKVIEIGRRGQIIVFMEGADMKVTNSTSCTLVVDGKLIQPGETV